MNQLFRIVKKYYLPLLAILFGVIYFVVHYQEQLVGFDHFDEGLRLFGAVNILEGKIPYRDFYFVYPPGYIYYLAVIFKLFGVTILNARIGALLIDSLSVSLAFLLAAGTGSIIFGITIVLSFINFFSISYIQTGVVPIILLEFLALNLFFKTNSKKLLLGAGLINGIIFFFRIDFAVYTFLAIISTLILHGLFLEKLNKRLKQKNIIKPILIFILGVMGGVIPLVVYLNFAGIKDAWLDLIYYPSLVPRIRHLPYPSLFPELIKYLVATNISLQYQKIVRAWPFYFPFLICILSVIDLIRRRQSLSSQQSNFFTRLLLAFSLVFFFVYTFSRPDIEHTWIWYFFVFALAPSAFEGLYFLIRRFQILKTILLILIMFCGIFFGSVYNLQLFWKYILLLSPIAAIYMLWIKRSNKIINLYPKILVVLFLVINFILLDYLRLYRRPIVNPNNLVLSKIPRAKGIYLLKGYEDSYEQLVDYILANNHQQPIFSGSTRHDRIFINDILLYFLAESSSSTKIWELDPGLITTKPIQNATINDLERSKPNIIILWTLASAAIEPNDSANSSGVFLLDNYIRENYQRVKKFGAYIVLERKGKT